MLIYRVEDHEGHGPYSTPNYDDDDYRNVVGVSMTSASFERHPVPTEDGIDKEALTSQHFFGFESIESLDSWFPGLTQNINKLKNWRISTYEIDKQYVLMGYSQVVFQRSKATKKGVYRA